MIYDSYPWKSELKKIRKYLKKCNWYDELGNANDIKRFHFEKNLFYSAFIIRKLIESDRTSDYIDNMSIRVKRYKPIRHVNRIYCFMDDDMYDWKNSVNSTIPIKEIINFLIHSYVFNIGLNDAYKAESFFVSSDYDRNKYLYEIQMKDWYDVLDKVGSDSIISRCSRYKENAEDYVSTKKERGKLK